MEEHTRWMDSALALAGAALGSTWPNPSVGCVIVKDGKLLARGSTALGGRPHAETAALEKAGEEARGATAYITLEPCAHHGKTPPCAEALIRAGVKKTVIACLDPDPRVSGKGIKMLREAGIETELGVRREEAEELNEGFFTLVNKSRPFVTLKMAVSLDGKVLPGNGATRWLTGEECRDYTHLLRASHDAVMVGIGTALADNPELTCRLPGLSHKSPVRVVLDSQNRLPASSRLLSTPSPLWVVSEKESGRAESLTIPSMDIEEILKELGKRGITKILAEGGPKLASSLLSRNLVDRFILYQAPLSLRETGLPAPLPPESMTLRKSFMLGVDLIKIFTPCKFSRP